MAEQAQQPQTKVGGFIWQELMSRDFPKAKAFYTSLFGWTTKEMDMGPAGKYTIFENQGVGVAGGMQITPDMSSIPYHWIGYVHVENVDASAQKAEQLGGKIMMPPTDIPDIGRFAIIQDPANAPIAIFKPSM